MLDTSADFELAGGCSRAGVLGVLFTSEHQRVSVHRKPSTIKIKIKTLQWLLSALALHGCTSVRLVGIMVCGIRWCVSGSIGGIRSVDSGDCGESPLFLENISRFSIVFQG